MVGRPTFEELHHKVAILEKECEQRQAALEKSQALFREICHRTLSHFQIICSMITLQAACAKNSEFTALLTGFENRIRSIALVHENQIHDRDLAVLDLKKYVSDLVAQLQLHHGVDPNRIECRLDVQELQLPLDQAVHIGLVINELVSNALIHAFPDQRQGVVRLEIHLIGAGDMELVVGDNGVGMAEGVDYKNAQTFGFQLVILLIETQLGGRIQLTSDRGTCFRMRIKTGAEALKANRGGD